MNGNGNPAPAKPVEEMTDRELMEATVLMLRAFAEMLTELSKQSPVQLMKAMMSGGK